MDRFIRLIAHGTMFPTGRSSQLRRMVIFSFDLRLAIRNAATFAMRFATGFSMKPGGYQSEPRARPCAQHQGVAST
jgi:hypothetical protein